MNKHLVLMVVAISVLSGCKSVSVRHTVELPVQVVESHHVHHPPPVVMAPPAPVIVQQHIHVPASPAPAPVHVPGPVIVVKPQPPVPPASYHRHQHGMRPHPQMPPSIHTPPPVTDRDRLPYYPKPIVAPQARRGVQVVRRTGLQRESAGNTAATAAHDQVLSSRPLPLPPAITPRRDMPQWSADEQDVDVESRVVPERRRDRRS